MPVPLLPIIIGGTTTTIGAITAWLKRKEIVIKIENFKNRKKLCVLGMPGAGKTRLVCFLRDESYQNNTTADKERFFNVMYKTKSGNMIKFKEIVDIGGTYTFVDNNYKETIENSEHVFCIFDIKRYMLEEMDYRRDCNSRLDLINEYIEKKKIHIIASHRDVILENDIYKIKSKMKELTSKKEYHKLLNDTDYISYLNLTDEKEVADYLEKLFNKSEKNFIFSKRKK